MFEQTRVKCAALFAQQAVVCRIPHQRVLELVGVAGWCAAPVHEPGCKQPFQGSIEGGLRVARQRGDQVT